MQTSIDSTGAKRSRTWRGIALLAANSLVLAACGSSVTALPATSGPMSTPTSPNLGPTTVASPTPSLAASATALPGALLGSWIDAPRAFSALSATAAALPVLTIDPRGISVRLDLSGQPSLVSNATPSGPATLSLTLGNNPELGGCAVGDVGTYGWSLAPGGAVLTLTATADPCAARSTAFTGTWTHSVCRNSQDLCLGAVPPGTYVSTFFDMRDASAVVPNRGAYGQLRYTLPAGWANGSDFPTEFNLIPAADYAGPVGVPDGPAFHGIYLFARPAAMADTTSCANQLAPGIGQTPAALTAWVASRPGVVATKPASITIGGDPGMLLDVRLAPSWTKKACPTDPSPTALLLIDAGAGADPWNWGVAPTERQRLIFVAVGGGPTVAIILNDNSTPSRFGELVAQAMPIIETFTFPQ